MPGAGPGPAPGTGATVRFAGRTADLGDRDEAKAFAKKLKETANAAGSWPEATRVNERRIAAGQTVRDLQVALLEERLAPTLLGTSCRVCARSGSGPDSVSDRL